jgi:low affinity Fe/Cu permease
VTDTVLPSGLVPDVEEAPVDEQNSQNRDSAAIQVKLDELIRVSKANNSFMGLEHLTDEELKEVQGKCQEHAQAVLAARTATATNR